MHEEYYLDAPGGVDYDAILQGLARRHVDCDSYREAVFQKRTAQKDRGLLKGIERAADRSARSRPSASNVPVEITVEQRQPAELFNPQKNQRSIPLAPIEVLT